MSRPTLSDYEKINPMAVEAAKKKDFKLACKLLLETSIANPFFHFDIKKVIYFAQEMQEWHERTSQFKHDKLIENILVERYMNTTSDYNKRMALYELEKFRNESMERNGKFREAFYKKIDAFQLKCFMRAVRIYFKQIENKV